MTPLRRMADRMTPAPWRPELWRLDQDAADQLNPGLVPAALRKRVAAGLAPAAERSRVAAGPAPAAVFELPPRWPALRTDNLERTRSPEWPASQIDFPSPPL